MTSAIRPSPPVWRHLLGVAWPAFFLLTAVFRWLELPAGEPPLVACVQAGWFATAYAVLYGLLLRRGPWVLSLVWLGLPYFLFAQGWLRWYWALPCMVVWAVSLWQALQLAPQARLEPGGGLLAGCLLVLAWVYLSGAGAHGQQSMDHAMHNGRLLDLIRYDWPVRYTDGLLLRDPAYGTRYTYLVGYGAYYLPAALWGKWAGYRAALEALHLWSLCGAWLALAWLVRGVGQRWAALAAIGLVFFGGLDVVAILHRFLAADGTAGLSAAIPSTAAFLASSVGDTGNLDFWPVGPMGFFFGNYLSNAAQLYWSPHQSLAAWVAGGLLLQAYRDKQVGVACFLYALLAYWSPMNLIAVSLIPLLIVLQGGWPAIRAAITFTNVIGGGLVLLVFGLYYFSGSAAVNPFGFFWAMAKPGAWMALLGFHLLAWGIYVLLLLPGKPALPPGTPLLLGVLALSFLWLGAIHYGTYNDLLCRGSAILMFILFALVLERLVALLKARCWGAASLLGICLVLGSVSAQLHLVRSLVHFDVEAQPQSVVDSIHGWEFLGPVDSFFVRHLSRDIAPTP